MESRKLKEKLVQSLENRIYLEITKVDQNHYTAEAEK